MTYYIYIYLGMSSYLTDLNFHSLSIPTPTLRGGVVSFNYVGAALFGTLVW